MSLRIFNLFVNSLRPNVQKYTLMKPAIQARSVTAMEIITETVDENNADLVKDKVLTRYKKRYMKRQWEELRGEKQETGESDEKRVCDKPFERIKRKKMAMLLGYCGVDYYGMQRNPGVPTIEEELLKALKEAKYITEDDFANQQNAQFQRSSRTDKGVSAARQVVSLKLPLEVKIEEINQRLPESIRVFGIKRVTNKFNSKTKCNARTYSYTLPTFTFEPSADDDEKRLAYRVTEEKLAKVNEVLGYYKGTKSYHNFTEKKHYHDPSACRYMMSFVVDRVFVTSDMEFAVLLVKGQSFMLHQIRKMVGLMVAVVRGHTDMSIMDKVFGKEKVMIPTIPGLGLVLDKVHYERYDAKFKNSHDSLIWAEEEPTIEKFIHDQINPNIVKGEIEGKSMATWLEKLSRHSYEPSDEVPEDKETLVGDDDDDDELDKVKDEGEVKDVDELKCTSDGPVTESSTVSTSDGINQEDKSSTVSTIDDISQENKSSTVSTTDGISHENKSSTVSTAAGISQEDKSSTVSTSDGISQEDKSPRRIENVT